ncbi:type VI secretion system-associated FHA domain protein TagH [Microvirga sp. 0TCS3.31]
MVLHLSIENELRLPDGGPLTVAVAHGRGLDIGRDPHLDWTLPDPTRTISGKHCEVRYHDGCYWLHDVSTNGTFVNGSDQRLQAPHRLRDEDRIEIGHYLISVSFDHDETASPGTISEPALTGNKPDIWQSADDVAVSSPAEDNTQSRFEARPHYSDFLDWAAEPPTPSYVRRMEARGEEDPAWIRRGAIEPDQSGPSPSSKLTNPPPRSDNPPNSLSSADFDLGEPRLLNGDMPAETPNVRSVLGLDSGSPRETAPASEAPPSRWAGEEFLRRFAEGAGIPEEVIAGQDPGAFAQLLGDLMRLVAEDLKSLLAARAESRRLARSTNQTMIQALDNNPLKFSPTAGDALRLMFGRPTSGYLDARRTLECSFRDLRVHQVKTYAAMQHALRMLVEDLDPEAIEESAPVDKGFVALTGSRKSRLWDTFVTRWMAKTAPHDDGLVNAFMIYFAECYDQIDKKSG